MVFGPMTLSAESSTTTFTVNAPVPHAAFCVKENEFEVEFIPAFRALATTPMLFDTIKL